jgi:hypothetical protein
MSSRKKSREPTEDEVPAQHGVVIETVVDRTVARGDHPNPEDLANYLRSGLPLSMQVRAYLAGLVDGSVKRPRGRPMPSERQKRADHVRMMALIKASGDLVWLLDYLKRREGRERGVLEWAIGIVAQAHGLSPDALRHYWTTDRHELTAEIKKRQKAAKHSRKSEL